MSAYLTISAPAESYFTEQRSKFLAFAHPVTTAEEAKALVKEYTNKYHDARHVCWAYMLGAAHTDYLSSDNGEPSGTAGKPILGQINSFNLTDVVVIVVRYFGGIKLGTSGLIAAYREAARLALDSADIVERHEQTRITFTFPYQAMNDVMKIIKSMPVVTEEQTFDNTCRITLSLAKDLSAEQTGRLGGISGVSIH